MIIFHIIITSQCAHVCTDLYEYFLHTSEYLFVHKGNQVFIQGCMQIQNIFLQPVCAYKYPYRSVRTYRYIYRSEDAFKQGQQFIFGAHSGERDSLGILAF